MLFPYPATPGLGLRSSDPVPSNNWPAFINLHIHVPLHSFTESDMHKKIVVQNPVVELDGDEMTRIIWKKIREEVRSRRNLGVPALILENSSSYRTCNSISSILILDWSTEIKCARFSLSQTLDSPLY